MLFDRPESKMATALKLEWDEFLSLTGRIVWRVEMSKFT